MSPFQISKEAFQRIRTSGNMIEFYHANPIRILSGSKLESFAPTWAIFYSPFLTCSHFAYNLHPVAFGIGSDADIVPHGCAGTLSWQRFPLSVDGADRSGV